MKSYEVSTYIISLGITRANSGFYGHSPVPELCVNNHSDEPDMLIIDIINSYTAVFALLGLAS
jgi:hypothetical protein